MKKLLLFLTFACTLSAQHRFRNPVVVIRPSHNFGGYYRPYYDPFYFGFGYYPYGETVVVRPESCHKEKLKDSEGKKHEVLVCRQPDGSFKVVADADHLK